MGQLVAGTWPGTGQVDQVHVAWLASDFSPAFFVFHNCQMITNTKKLDGSIAGRAGTGSG